MKTRISSDTKEVLIGDQQPTVIIGERINPTGKKKLLGSLRTGDFDIVRKEAFSQVEAGADILDVNVSIFGVDEESLLPQAVQAVMETVEVPLCLDSAKPQALQAALRVYKGKALINSVTGEDQSLEEILPLVKAHGAAVIGLLQDDEGLPKDADNRLAIARKIVERAQKAGIPREDIVIDCLAMAVGAVPDSGLAVIEAIRRIKDELGVNLTLGASNISFGMPNRYSINSAYLAMVIEAGVTCVIVDAAKVRTAILSADLILNRDKRARRFLSAQRKK